jgi:glutamate carboxypeptidase
MAHKIIALQELTDLTKGITVNVGVVRGGQTINTVAPSASGELDLRYIAPEDRDAMVSKIAAIMAHSTVAGKDAERHDH